MPEKFILQFVLINIQLWLLTQPCIGQVLLEIYFVDLLSRFNDLRQHFSLTYKIECMILLTKLSRVSDTWNE
jgi:hypothetical protein